MTLPNALTCVCLLGLLLPGCGKDEERRATAGFSIDAARASLQRFQDAVASGDSRAIDNALSPARSNLQAVVVRLSRESPKRKEERLAAAKKAVALFEELQPQLARLPANDAKARFAQILALLDEIQTP